MRIKRTSGYESGRITLDLLNLFSLGLLGLLLLDICSTKPLSGISKRNR